MVEFRRPLRHNPCRLAKRPTIRDPRRRRHLALSGKIKAATEAREDSAFRIIVRTDVIGTMPIEEYQGDNHIEQVVERSNAYAAAGADAIFIMAAARRGLSRDARIAMAS